VSTAPPILLVLSDRPLGEALTRELSADGFGVELAHSAAHARSLARRRPPRLALLGPGDPVTELLAEIRAPRQDEGTWDRALPVLVIGRESGGLEALRLLEAGADDFMAVPVSYLELRARLRGILRRASAAPSHRLLRVGPLRLDLDARRAGLKGRELELCRIEFDLLAHLARDPQRAFTREELLRAVWGYPADAVTRTLDTHASSLRRKLAVPSGERWIASVRGIGYRLI
jgi:DNA-binding response OmpR family regulator